MKARSKVERQAEQVQTDSKTGLESRPRLQGYEAGSGEVKSGWEQIDTENNQDNNKIRAEQGERSKLSPVGHNPSLT